MTMYGLDFHHYPWSRVSTLSDPCESFNSSIRAWTARPDGTRYSSLRQKFKPLSSDGHSLLASLLMYDPKRRISAEAALSHGYFKYVTPTSAPMSETITDARGRENPLPKHPDLFPSFPSQAAGERRHKLLASPSAPVREDREAKAELTDLESFV